MREKTKKAVVTFASTSDAMAMEAAARAHGIPGRIIPVPSEIDAGCGLSWCVDASDLVKLKESLEAYSLAHEAISELMLY